MSHAVAASENWFGPEYAANGWAPAPRYLLRRARILHHMRKMQPGKLLEIGSATGALLNELTELGFDCTGLESSDQAFALANEVGAGGVALRKSPDENWSENFDYCCAFEVLEHIESDREALRQWSRWLRPGGKMLLSVPAHPKLWNGRDVWAGHYRRYRKTDLEQALEAANLKIITIEHYGFPLANILEVVAARRYKDYLHQDRGDIEKAKATATSGVDRALDVKIFQYYAKFPGSLAMRAMIETQRLFTSTPIGNGLLAIAEKPVSAPAQ